MNKSPNKSTNTTPNKSRLIRKKWSNKAYTISPRDFYWHLAAMRFKGCSWQEISEFTGRTIYTCKNSMARAPLCREFARDIRARVADKLAALYVAKLLDRNPENTDYADIVAQACGDTPPEDSPAGRSSRGRRQPRRGKAPGSRPGQ